MFARLWRGTSFFSRNMSAESSVPPCCPAGSAPYLAPDTASKGSKRSIAGAEYYVTGDLSSKRAVVMCPDIWGWDSGRTRVLADHVGSQGFLAVVPKLLQPCLDEGTHGDGFPPNFDFSTRGPDFKTYLSKITWDAVLRPILVAIFADLKGQGVERIALTGFCWGSCPVAYSLSEPALMAQYGLTCGVMCHPSLSIEQRVFDRNPTDLVDRIQGPVLFMPAGNDQVEYRAHGAWYQSLHARVPATETLDFPEMMHGWVPRGDASKPEVARDVQRAMEAMLAYINKNMSL